MAFNSLCSIDPSLVPSLLIWEHPSTLRERFFASKAPAIGESNANWPPLPAGLDTKNRGQGHARITLHPIVSLMQRIKNFKSGLGKILAGHLFCAGPGRARSARSNAGIEFAAFSGFDLPTGGRRAAGALDAKKFSNTGDLQGRKLAIRAASI